MPVTSRAPTMWRVGGRSVMGAAHVRLQIPNQDAIAWTPPGGQGHSAVLALSDGHGARRHFRSGIGAHIAVDVATAVLSDACAEPGQALEAAPALRALADDIVARWRAQVRSHVFVRPFDDTQAVDKSTPFVPYGATLIAVAATPAGVALIQLGDGDLLVGRTDGTVLRPLPNDEGLLGQQTYSLCQPDAESRMRLRFIAAGEADIDFIMLSTDGLSKSFPGESEFLKLGAFWRGALAQDGLASVMQRLDPWLADISRQGSGDDITLGFIQRAS